MEDQNTPDPTLAVQAKKDRHAFVALYQRHLKRVYVYHLARTGNVQDSQDLTSETFLAALSAIAGYRPERSFAAWLLGIAHHKLADFYGRRGLPQSSLDEVGDPPAPGAAPDLAAAQRIDLKRVRQVLRLLPVERADALSLRYFSELSLAEVALVMGKNEAAVKMLIYRGLQEMRDRLGSGVLEEV